MEAATQMTEALSLRFEARTGRRPEVAARAPGRVNLIGEHTDYSEGLVLPCAIDRYTEVVAARREDSRIVVHALDLDQSAAFDARSPERRGDWLDYVQGVVFAMAERGLVVAGAELAVSSRVPSGAGLSSSAALGVAVCGALSRLLGADASPREWAELAHRGENHFVGVGCGILDQYASALGRPRHALRIDCRSRDLSPVAFGGEPLVILIAHSGVERQLATAGAYRARVDECEAAFAAIERAGLVVPPARTLRDVPESALSEVERLLPPTLFRRARHVVTENARVDRFCTALIEGDRDRLGVILRDGQASLRDDYEVSIPELDHLCDVANGCEGVVGSRLTGAGFGGCTLHLVDARQTDTVQAGIADGFEARFGRRPQIFRVEPAEGATAFLL